MIPIVFLVFIFVVIIVIVRSNNLSQQRWMQGFVFKTFILSYLVILLLSAAIFPLLPFKQIEGKMVESDKMIDEIHNDFYESIGNMEKPDLEKMVLRNSYEIDFADETLYISSEDDGFYTDVIVERRSDLNEKIKVMVYSTPSIVDNIDVTDDMPSFLVDWNNKNDGKNNELMLSYPKERYEIYFSKFNKEFPITQFTEERSQNDNYFQSYFGHSFLYIEVPENVNVQTELEYINLYYVN